MPYDQISDALTESYIKGYYDPPKSETYTAVRKRVWNFVEELFQKYSNTDRILVVSHAGVIRQVRDNFLPNYDKSAIKNSSTLMIQNEDYENYLQAKENEEQCK